MNSSARVLVVNADPAESEKLTKKLLTQGYDGIHASNADALRLIQSHRPDVVIVAGGEAPVTLAGALKTAKLPVIMIAQAGAAQKLSNGADSCLPFHYHDLQLFGRIESMLRLAAMHDELRRRRETAQTYGVTGPDLIIPQEIIRDAYILLVGLADSAFENIAPALSADGVTLRAGTASTAMSVLEQRRCDAIILDVQQGNEAEAFQFCEDVRRNSQLFNIPIICLFDSGDSASITAAYTAGAADVFHHPVSLDDLRLRIDVLVRQQRYRDALRQAYHQPRNVATTDALTGLYNHGFLMQHLTGLVADARACGKNLAVGGFSVDNLAGINAAHGYATGDKILRQIGLVVSTLVRGEDLPARLGGGKFILAMPETPLAAGELVAHRIGSVINFTELMAEDAGQALRPHVSTGVASLEPGMSAEALIAKALGKA